MESVLVRHAYLVFAAALIAYSRRSVVLLVTTTNQRHAWRTEIPSYAVCQWPFT